MTNNVVFNQDDAVAVTSGGDIVWDNSYCYGGHGASIGSVGLKSNNTVDGVIFSNTQIIASQNGARIKTNSGASGTINNVTYSNIQVQDISIYGVRNGLRKRLNERSSMHHFLSHLQIDIQQDYCKLAVRNRSCPILTAISLVNGGPTGQPTNGVNITNIFMHNIHGNVLPTADNYYILVGGASADPSTWKFTGINIKGGNSSCNVVPQGFNCK
jgi:polygalacturonase